MSTQLTVAQLRSIAGSKAKESILTGVVSGLPLIDRFNILPPHRLAHFIAQIGHESDRFATTKEYASGKAYEGRRDLGNTQPGDGPRFKGHGLIQCTGRANHRDFAKWCKANGFKDVPDFEREPERAAEFPWALIGVVWYWTTRDLNRYADDNNIEMITRKINGGLNGYDDRVALYVRTGLVLLGYEMKEGVVALFQKEHGLTVDDIPGPKTRAAIHAELKKLGEVAAIVAPPVVPVSTVGAPPPGAPAASPTFLERLAQALKTLFGV